MAEPWPPIPAPLARAVDDHLRAWGALAAAAAEVAQLPARTAIRLVVQDARPAADPLADALAAQAELEAALGAARAQIAALEARIVEIGAAHAAQVEELRRTYWVLERDVAAREWRAADDLKLRLYGLLEPLLAQLPLVRHAVAQGRPVEATDLLDLLGPLDEALAAVGFARIGEVGAEVAFDPTRHQPAGIPAPEAGAAVTVKHPGFCLEERVLRRARVGARQDVGGGP